MTTILSATPSPRRLAVLPVAHDYKHGAEGPRAAAKRAAGVIAPSESQ